MTTTDARATALLAQLDHVTSVPVDDLGEAALRAELDALTAAKRRIEARTCRALSRLHTLHASAAAAADPDDLRAVDRARRELDRELREDLRLTPSQLKTARAVGDRLQHSPLLAEAMASGRLTADHARVLDRTLRPLGRDDRERLERELVQLAVSGMDAAQFGRECRRRLAAVDLEAATRAEARRHLRRRAASTQTTDGMYALSGEWTGLDAEILRTGIDAFMRPDSPGERRTSEQRFADAVTDMARAALGDGCSSTNHGVRPHIVVTVDLDTLVDRGELAPVAEGAWTGPMLWPMVRHILDDSSVSFLAIGNDLPVAVTEEVRTVPASVWKGLVHRDRGCIREGCDIPAPWTDVMHLEVPWAEGGRLSFRTAALGCRPHHRDYDEGRLRLHWAEGRPVLRPPPRA